MHKLCPTEVPQARVVIITAPGEEGQVDYGTGPMVRDPQSAKYRRTRLFVMTLGFPRVDPRWPVRVRAGPLSERAGPWGDNNCGSCFRRGIQTATKWVIKRAARQTSNGHPRVSRNRRGRGA